MKTDLIERLRRVGEDLTVTDMVEIFGITVLSLIVLFGIAVIPTVIIMILVFNVWLGMSPDYQYPMVSIYGTWVGMAVLLIMIFKLDESEKKR